MSVADEHSERRHEVDIDLTAAGIDRTLRTAPRPVVELPPALRGRRVPRDVRGWAVFQPNAPGRGELRSREALLGRQLLKGRRQYISERVLVVVGARSVAMWHLLPGGVAGRCAGWWDLGNLLALPTAPAGVVSPWPAAALIDLAAGRPVADLRAIRCDVHSFRVLSALGAG